MKRLFLAALLCAAFSFPAHAQIGGGIFGDPTNPQVIEVGEGKAYSEICNADPNNAPTADCAAGTAFAAITDSAIDKRYIVRVWPGTYGRVVWLDKGWITLDLMAGAIITPANKTNGTPGQRGVVGGCVSVAPSGNATPFTGNGITGSGLIHCNHGSDTDSNGSPEGTAVSGAVHLGPIDGTGGDAHWGTFTIGGDVTIRGAAYGLVIQGSETASDTNSPKILMGTNVKVQSARRAIYHEGNWQGVIPSKYITTDTSMCSPNAGVHSGTVGTDSNDTTHVHLDGLLAGNDNINDRTVTLAGTCPAQGDTVLISDWVLSTELATTAVMSGAPDPNCTFVTAAPERANQTDCTDPWMDTVIVTSALGQVSALATKADTALAPGAGTVLDFTGAVMRVYANSGLNSPISVVGAQITTTGSSNDDDIAAETIIWDVDLFTHMSYDSAVAAGGSVPEVIGLYLGREFPSGELQVSGTIKVQNDDPEWFTGGFWQQASASGTRAGNIRVGNLVFNVAGGATIDDVVFEDGANDIFISSIKSLQNAGIPRWQLTAVTSGVGTPKVFWSGAQKVITNFSDTVPVFDTAQSPAMASGDLLCRKVTTHSGTQLIGKAIINVATLEAAKLCSVCAYTEDGADLLLDVESISCSATGDRVNNAVVPYMFPPGDIWICIGSDAAGTLVLNGRASLGTTLGATTVQGRLATGAATCPATIAPGSMTTWLTPMPEVILIP